jgi:hypothetical protein
MLIIRRIREFLLKNETDKQNIPTMKKIGFILLMLSGISCVTTERSGLLPQDELVITRKYVGNFVSYTNTSSSGLAAPHILLVKTSQDSIYGEISICSRRCKFEPGERLYIRRGYQPNGRTGYWIYQIENEKENKIWYRLSDFEYGLKL